MIVRPDREKLFITGALTLILFSMVLGFVIWGPKLGEQDPRSGPEAKSAGRTRSVGAPSEAQTDEGEWARDNGVSNLVAAPPPSYELSAIPRSRRVWHSSVGGMESWGFVSDADATDIGVAVLDHYLVVEGWELGRSERLDLSGTAWGGTFFRRRTQEVVMYVVLPERLGEAAGSSGNSTRVSVLRIAGEDALREVVEQHAP